MAVASTGFFDGVHSGHRKVIGQLCSMASLRGEKSLIVSFWPHPRVVLHQDDESLRLLSSLEEKREMCLDCGVDEFVVLPFTEEFSRLSAKEFLNDYLKDLYGVTLLVIGYDHRFGHDLTDDNPERVMEIVSSCGIEPCRVGQWGNVSSTVIRRLIGAGDVAEANALLGYRYGLRGRTVPLDSRVYCACGEDTMELILDEPLKLLPKEGRYSVTAEVSGIRCGGFCTIFSDGSHGYEKRGRVAVSMSGFVGETSDFPVRVEFIDRI